MVAYVMSKGMVSKVIVGADRIVKDAIINKIGTFGLAIIAKKFNIPFYVAAPISTFDISSTSSSVRIEERDAKEVTHINGKGITPEGVEVFNPAFDITPLDFVEAIITEYGVIHSPKSGDVEEFLNSCHQLGSGLGFS